jgi:hypothetical protein
LSGVVDGLVVWLGRPFADLPTALASASPMPSWLVAGSLAAAAGGILITAFEGGLLARATWREGTPLAPEAVANAG